MHRRPILKPNDDFSILFYKLGTVADKDFDSKNRVTFYVR